jgi:hypothetical protein
LWWTSGSVKRLGGEVDQEICQPILTAPMVAPQ